MTRSVPLLTLLVLVACDGVGRPIVGPIDHPDGGGSRRCEASPGCRPVPTLPEDHFAVPRTPIPPTALDCDGDLVDDAIDNCLGVPNPTQGPTDCEGARASCDRLAAGDLALAGADLRGCVPNRPVVLTGELSLRGADLRCSVIAFEAPSEASVDLREAVVTSTQLSLTAEAPATLDAGRTTFTRSTVSVGGAARLLADSAIFEECALFVAPGSGATDGPGASAIDVTASNFAQTTIYEAPSRRPGRVRIERSQLTATRIDARVLGLYGASATASRLAADELDVQDTELTSSEVRSERAAFAGATMVEVVFDRCVDLRISHSELVGVDIPACPPERLHVGQTQLEGCNLAGGAELEEAVFLAGVIGGGPATTLTARESELDGARFCDLGAARFLGGELRCIQCDDDAFRHGASVCVSGTTLIERGCPAIELAPACE
ncbi:MAG: hypothetical protein R3B82_05145 [Sandaracinaceae bacterium]